MYIETKIVKKQAELNKIGNELKAEFMKFLQNPQKTPTANIIALCILFRRSFIQLERLKEFAP